MEIEWSKVAIKQLITALDFIEENGFDLYSTEVETSILSKVQALLSNPIFHPVDKFKNQNDGSYRAFETYNYRISYRLQKNLIKIIRIRHTSRRTKGY